jgi:hypothetical protein
MGYDIIGDVHGQLFKLKALLRNLGYSEQNGAYRHPERMVIFVGDLIDRGVHQLAVLQLARRMVDAGTALIVAGNHEFNAVAYYCEDPRSPGEHLRRHSKKNTEQHQAFLAEISHDPKHYREWIDWLVALPLWLDLPGLRVVHACWDDDAIATLGPHLMSGNAMNFDLVAKASDESHPFYDCVETLLKGPEVRLPEGHEFLDPSGHRRHNVRVRWWDDGAATYADAAMLDAEAREALPHTLLPDTLKMGYHADKPVFIGHYWLRGVPAPLTPRVVCCDYSAGRNGDLVAYRWNGESTLSTSAFCSSAALSTLPDRDGTSITRSA